MLMLSVVILELHVGAGTGSQLRGRSSMCEEDSISSCLLVHCAAGTQDVDGFFLYTSIKYTYVQRLKQGEWSILCLRYWNRTLLHPGSTLVPTNRKVE
ncbi:hypothetical protein F5X97DRAFT_311350 [Nemania serpens]|nr:hypothetical protein F5X97DRAFT_311350 [Nemania serpens]